MNKSHRNEYMKPPQLGVAKKPYHAPAILSRQSLEAVAVGPCGKELDNPSCLGVVASS